METTQQQDRTFELAKQLLDEHGYVFIQCKGSTIPLRDEHLQELDKIAYRLEGFDGMFNSDTFRTITYINSADGFLEFLKEPICSRFVKHISLENLPIRKGTIYTDTPKLYLHLNSGHHRIDLFKASFIGKSGKKIRELSKFIDHSISLVDEPVK